MESHAGKVEEKNLLGKTNMSVLLMKLTRFTLWTGLMFYSTGPTILAGYRQRQVFRPPTGISCGVQSRILLSAFQEKHSKGVSVYTHIADSLTL